MKKEYLKQLAETLQRHAPEETILVCGSRAEGRRMMMAVAALGYVLVGVRAETPYSLARELCAAKLSETGAPRFIEEIEGAELVRSCMSATAGIFSGVNAKTLSATRAFYRTFQEMTLAGLPANLEGHPALEQLPKLKELQKLRTDYAAKKAEANLVDRGDLFAMALEAAEGSTLLNRAHYVVLGDYAPSLLERRLLEKLSASKGLTVVALDCAKDLSADKADAEGQFLPVNAMAAQLPRRDALAAVKNGSSRFVACRGVETEVRFPLRDILDKQLPLEDCAIVYLNSSYAQRLYETAARYHLPATLGGGLPLMGSLLYTTLKTVENLPLSDFYAEEVCALLENGSCGPKEWPISLAERMRRVKVGWNAERYALAWEYEKEELGKPKNYTTEQWKDLLSSWKDFLTVLLAVAQPTGDLKQQKTDMLTFLGYCQQKSGSEAMACAKAKSLTERIIALEEGETLLHRLLMLMETSSYLGGAAEPGKLYLAPLSQAACINRKHLYIVGFSRYALQGIRKESPILLDKEREALGGLKTSAQLGREQEFRLLTLLVRHEGDFVLTYPDFDSEGMLTQEPAPFFKEAAGENIEQVTYLPAGVYTPADLLLTSDYIMMQPTAGCPGDAEGETIDLQPQKTRREMLENLEYSATMLEEALKCPYAFYLKRLMRIRAPQEVERKNDVWLDAMTIGSFCHAVLEKHYMRPEGSDWEDLFEAEFHKLKHDVPMPHPAMEQAEKDKLHHIVEPAVAWTTAEKRKVLATEEPFENEEMHFGKWTIRLKGSIDRVDELSDGSIAIVDYKTGDPKRFKSELHRHWQHYLYTVAEEQRHPDRQVSRAGYLLLREDAEMVEHTENADLREETAARIEWLLDRISAEDYVPECAPAFKPKTKDDLDPNLPPPKPVMLEPTGYGAGVDSCKYLCEFAEICPAAKGGSF